MGRGVKHGRSPDAPFGPHAIPIYYFSCPLTHASRRLPLLVIWRPIRKIPLSRRMGKAIRHRPACARCRALTSRISIQPALPGNEIGRRDCCRGLAFSLPLTLHQGIKYTEPLKKERNSVFGILNVCEALISRVRSISEAKVVILLKESITSSFC